MTDRIFALTVALESDIREDDAEALLSAIRQLRGVLGVTPHVADHTFYVAQSRISMMYRQKILDAVKVEY